MIREVSRVRQLMLEEAERRSTKDGDTFSFKVRATKITHFNKFIFEGAIIAILAGRENFLRVAWQKLSSSDKEQIWNFIQRATQMHNQNFQSKNPMLVLDASLKGPSLGESTLNAWKTKRLPKTPQKIPTTALEVFLISGFFQVNMSYTQRQLRVAFSDWLKANHPEADKKLPERRGRNPRRDWLNALGALRLRYYCKTFTAANAKLKLYADRRSFNRASKAAVEHFRTLLKLDGEHLPIHFTKGWQK